MTKNLISSLFFLAIVACSMSVSAQSNSVDTTASKKKLRHTVSISKEGVQIKNNDTSAIVINKTDDDDDDNDSTGSRFKSNFMLLDLGFNLVQDNTDYTNPEVKKYLNVPAASQNKSLFDLRPGKSVNVNIYPWMLKFIALRTKNQRIYLSTGIGLQLYNFRYENPVTFTKNPQGVLLDSVSFKKDKLGLDYLNVPLLLTFKTRLYGDHWLVYGAGISEGYLIASWNKQVSGARGKTKVHDDFGLANFNTCLSFEAGIDGAIRFFATYQLTSMFGNGLDQHPVSFGIRFSGI